MELFRKETRPFVYQDTSFKVTFIPFILSETYQLIVLDTEKLDTEIFRNSDGTADSTGMD